MYFIEHIFQGPTTRRLSRESLFVEPIAVVYFYKGQEKVVVWKQQTF